MFENNYSLIKSIDYTNNVCISETQNPDQALVFVIVQKTPPPCLAILMRVIILKTFEYCRK